MAYNEITALLSSAAPWACQIVGESAGQHAAATLPINVAAVVVVPAGPLVVIPYLWMKQPRGTDLGWLNTLLASLAVPAALIGLFSAVYAWVC